MERNPSAMERNASAMERNASASVLHTATVIREPAQERATQELPNRMARFL